MTLARTALRPLPPFPAPGVFGGIPAPFREALDAARELFRDADGTPVGRAADLSRILPD